MTGHDAQNEAIFSEIHRLATSCLDGDATAATLERLEFLVRDPDVLDIYMEYLNDSISLRQIVSKSAESEVDPVALSADIEIDDSVDPSACLSTQESSSPHAFLTTLHGTVGYFSSGWPVAYLVAAVIFGVGLLVGTLVHVSQPQVAKQFVSLPSPLSSLPCSSPFVGRITGMVDCRWESSIHPSSFILHPSSLVALGDTFALASGLMEITYDTGAKVILQGPCTYEVESPVGGYLSVGKLTARVEKKATSLPSPSGRGAGGEGSEKNQELSDSSSSFLIPHSYFAVRTPTATVNDLGTEFGVEVDKEGCTTSHVFRGSIEVRTLEAGADDESAVQVLRENESARVTIPDDGDGDLPRIKVSPLTADAVGFVREIRGRGLAPKLAHLWTFDSSGDDNVGGSDYNLTFSGSAACDTSDAQIGTGSLSGLTTAQSYAVVKRYFAPDSRFTLSAWIKTRSGGIGHTVFAWGQRNSNGLSRQFRLGGGEMDQPHVGHILYGQGAGQDWKSVSTGAFEVNDGAWHHVAITRDRHIATLYVDGVTRSEWTSYLMGGEPETGEVTIGGMTFKPYHFCGRIDDLGYWSSLLGARHIRAIYHLGNHPAMRYSQKDIASLFDLYSRGSGQVVCAGHTWAVCSSLPERKIGSLVDRGNGTFTLYLDTHAGLTTSSIQADGVYALPRQSTDVGGEILAQHLGSADPATEQFLQDVQPGGVGPGTDTIGGKTPVWNADTIRPNCYIYKPSKAQIASAQSFGWEAEATVRPASYPLPIKELGGNGMGIWFSTDPGDATGTRAYSICIGADSSGNPLLGWVNDHRAHAATPIAVTGVSGAGFHTYKLVCEKPETNTAKVYVDGIYQTTIHALTGSSAYPNYSKLIFGSGCDRGDANTGHWAKVTFRTLPKR